MQPWSPGVVVGSTGLSLSSLNQVIAAFSIRLSVTSDDPAWSLKATTFEVLPPAFLVGSTNMVANWGNFAIVYARDIDTYRVSAKLPPQQFFKQGDEVGCRYKIFANCLENVGCLQTRVWKKHRTVLGGSLASMAKEFFLR